MKITQSYNTDGTYLQGTMTATYDELVETFGQPEEGCDGKTQVEWAIKIDGVVCTIYDWKRDGDPKTCTNWNVGGFRGEAVYQVVQALKSDSSIYDEEPEPEGEEYTIEIYETHIAQYTIRATSVEDAVVKHRACESDEVKGGSAFESTNNDKGFDSIKNVTDENGNTTHWDVLNKTITL